MKTLQFAVDENQIGIITLDQQDSSANTMNADFQKDFGEVVEKIKSSQTSLKGIILKSAKTTFFAGGDLKSLVQVKPGQTEEFFHSIQSLKKHLRTLENMAIPVVAAINGAALGGGWELALSCNHRICLSHKKIKLGLPEVTLGLLPGAGGIVRMVRMLGLEKSLKFLIEGKQFSPQEGFDLGLINQLVEEQDDLLKSAKTWILENPKVQQIWDQKNYKIPGGNAHHPQLAKKIAAMPAILWQKTRGCYPAPKQILSTAVDSLNLDFDTALTVESRNFCTLVTGSVAKNMIQTFWFDQNAIKAGIRRPKVTASKKIESVGVLGAGMMGAGISFVTAKSGFSTKLKDTSLEKANKGKQWSEKIIGQRLEKGYISEKKAAEILNRIEPVDQYSQLQACDLVVEAVFENREIKAEVTNQSENVMALDSIFASNTSTLPISGLAKVSKRPEQFVGLHFFSPVHKMPLVEIIVGQKTSPETVASVFDFVLSIGKVPIIVQDQRGFFTSRVFGTYINEGIAMLGEGQYPASIEQAAIHTGMPVGPLAVTDEVSLDLVHNISLQTKSDFAAEGKEFIDHPSNQVIAKMVQLERLGKKAGKGFYEYTASNKKVLWDSLKAHFPIQNTQIPFEDIKDRLLFIQSIETMKCLEERVLESVREANIGSVLGFGFPAWTGGALQFVNQYGLRNFYNRTQELAEKYGDRFKAPSILAEKAESNSTFGD